MTGTQRAPRQQEGFLTCLEAGSVRVSSQALSLWQGPISGPLMGPAAAAAAAAVVEEKGS